MPRGDRTGPDGLGPMTGRAAGYCAGYSVPGFINPDRGFGRGMARRRGRGWGRGYGRIGYPLNYQPTNKPPTKEEEIKNLENYQKQIEIEKTNLDQEAKAIQTKLEELRK